MLVEEDLEDSEDLRLPLLLLEEVLEDSGEFMLPQLAMLEDIRYPDFQGLENYLEEFKELLLADLV